MLIGIPKEIKANEYRVAMSPRGVYEVITHGHEVMVEKDAGAAIGYSDEQYQDAGALILDKAEDIFAKADLIVKVKEPQEAECNMLKEGQVIFSYLHLAADKKQTELLIKSKAVAIAYETVTDNNGNLPLLAPMSEIAGKVTSQVSAYLLQKFAGGAGILIGGATGVEPAKVTIIGGGIAGLNAAIIASGMGAEVTILERSINKIQELNKLFFKSNKVKSIFATAQTVEEYAIQSDIVIGAVLVPGATAPKILTREALKNMRPGSIVADISIDQGGCFETSKPTTHQNPTFIVDDIIHYCVSNIPAAVAKTATMALENVTLPYIIEIANKGYKTALADNNHLLNGLNIYNGHITWSAVANSFGFEYVNPSQFFYINPTQLSHVQPKQ